MEDEPFFYLQGFIGNVVLEPISNQFECQKLSVKRGALGKYVHSNIILFNKTTL